MEIRQTYFSGSLFGMTDLAANQPSFSATVTAVSHVLYYNIINS